MMRRRCLVFATVVCFGALMTAFGQTTHYALNDDGAHEVGFSGTIPAGCMLPFIGSGGSFGIARFGYGPGLFHFAIFSFDMETWSAGDSYILRFTEHSREGTPFEEFGNALIEIIDRGNPYPGRFGQAMTVAGSYTEEEFFAPEGIDLSEAVNRLLSGAHQRYLYLRFRFENCKEDHEGQHWIQLVAGAVNNPNTTVRIVQGSSVRSTYFAQFADGDGFSSQIVLVNLDPARAATARVRIRKSNGDPMTVDLGGEPAVGERTVEIPANGTVILQTGGIGALQVGSATVVSDTNLSAVVLFSSPLGYAGVGASRPLRSIVIPVRTDLPGTNVGLAAMSLGRSQTLSLSLLSDTGVVLATAERNLVAEGQDARFVNEYEWDQPVDLANFTGSLVVVGEEDFAAVAILVRPNQFATLPVGEKPLMQ